MMRLSAPESVTVGMPKTNRNIAVALVNAFAMPPKMMMKTDAIPPVIVRAVLGFCVSEDRKQVLLISKLRPTWQAGKLNGIGGKIEADETPVAAMEREFFEEVGCRAEGWLPFAVLRAARYEVHCFLGAMAHLNDARCMTDETPVVVEVAEVMRQPTSPRLLPNVPWLIAMGLSIPKETFAGYQIEAVENFV
jgi:8-oxo-dGTP diphosphatase